MNYLYGLPDGNIYCERVLIEDVVFTTKISYDECLEVIKKNNLPLFDGRSKMLAVDAYVFFLKNVH